MRNKIMNESEKLDSIKNKYTLLIETITDCFKDKIERFYKNDFWEFDLEEIFFSDLIRKKDFYKKSISSLLSANSEEDCKKILNLFLKRLYKFVAELIELERLGIIETSNFYKTIRELIIMYGVRGDERFKRIEKKINKLQS